MSVTQSELEELKELISSRLEAVNIERTKAEREIQLVESRADLTDSEQTIRLDSMHKALDEIIDREIDLDRLMLALPKPKVSDGNAPQSWFEYLEWLNTGDNRRIEGENIEIQRMAAAKAKERLSEWHVYGNSVADQPLLSADSVGDE